MRIHLKNISDQPEIGTRLKNGNPAEYDYMVIASVRMSESLEQKSAFNALFLQLSRIEEKGLNVLETEDGQIIAATPQWWARNQTAAQKIIGASTSRLDMLPGDNDDYRLVENRLRVEINRLANGLQQKYGKNIVNEFLNSDEWRTTLRQFAADYLDELKKQNLPPTTPIKLPSWFKREIILRVGNYYLRKK